MARHVFLQMESPIAIVFVSQVDTNETSKSAKLNKVLDLRPSASQYIGNVPNVSF